MKPVHLFMTVCNAMCSRGDRCVVWLVLLLSVVFGQSINAATSTWTGLNGDHKWTTAGNWDTVPVAGSDLVFAGTTDLAPNNDFAANTSFASITFNNTAGLFVITGNQITLAGTITNNDTQLQTLNIAMAMAATRTVNAASGNITLGGILSGAGGLTKTGANTLTLSGTNTFTGITTMTAGILSVATIGNGGVAGNMGQASNAAANLVFNGGTLQYTGLTASTDRNFTLTAATTGTIDVTTNTLTMSGASTATTGILTKIGTGTLVLSGTNLHTGGTNINAGALSTGVAGGLSNTGTVTVGASGTLNLTASGTITYTFPTLSGSGTLNVTLGTGTQTTQAANTSKSGFTGIANIGVGAAAGAGKFTNSDPFGTAATVNVLANATLYAISGTHDCQVTLNGGDTGEALGQLRLGNGATWSGNVVIAGAISGAGDCLIGLNGADSGTISGVISESGGSRALSKGGTGSLSLTNASTYTGATILNQGTLALSGGNNRLPTGTTLAFNAAAANNPTMVLNLGTTNQTVAQLTVPDLANTTVSVTGSGSSTLTINGANNLEIGTGGAPAGIYTYALDLSGLPNFVYNAPANTFRIGAKNGVTGTNSGSATVTLAAANTITALNLLLADQTASADGGNGILRMGIANTFNVGTISIGASGRSDGTLMFNAGSSAATFRNTNGTSAVTAWNVGQVATYNATTYGATVDLSNGTTDALVTTMAIGTADIGGAATRLGTMNAVFTLGAGTLTATDITVGRMTNTGGTVGAGALTANGTLNINHASAVLNVTTLTLGTNTISDSGGTRTITSTVNLTAGTLNATTITRGAQTGTATLTQAFNWTTGTIANIASTNLAITSVPITLSAGTHTFDIAGANTGTLDAVSVISGASGIAKIGTGNLTLLGANTYSGTTTITAGTLQYNADNALSGTGGIVLNGGTLYHSAASTLGNALSVTGNSVVQSNDGEDIDFTSNSISWTAGTLSVDNSTTTGTHHLEFSGSGFNYGGEIIITDSNSGLRLKNASGGQEFSGVISGSGAGNGFFREAGGTTTLSATNTLTYDSSLIAGTLLITGSTDVGSVFDLSGTAILGGTGTVSGTVTLAAGTTLAPGTGGTTQGVLNTGAVSFSGAGTLSVDLMNGTPANEKVNATGTFTCTNGLLTVASESGSVVGTVYTIVSATAVSGEFSGKGHGSTFVSAGSRTYQIFYSSTTVTLLDVTGVANGTKTWDGGGSDNNWTTAANWSTDVAPLAGDALVFAGSVRLAPNNNYPVATSFSSITFDNTADLFVIGGNQITLAGDVTNNDTQLQTLNIAMDMAATRTLNAASGNITLGGILSGAGGLTKTGANTLTLSGTNTFTGITTMTAGILSVATIGNGGVAGNMGQASNAAANLVFNGGTLQYTGLTASTDRNFTLTAATTGTIDVTTNTLTMSGASTATTGILTKIGTGTLVLSGTNLHTGGTNINAGAITTNIEGALSNSGTVTVGLSGTLNLTKTGISTYTFPNLSGSGTVNVTLGTGSNTTAFAGTSKSGFTGIVNVGVGAAINSGKLHTGVPFNAIAIVNVLVNGTLFLSTGTHAYTINLYGGNPGETLGQLRLDGNAIASGNIVIAGDMTADSLIGSNSGHFGTISGVISESGGSRALSKGGAGTITFSGTQANTYTGVTTIKAGTLVLSKTGGVVAIAGDVTVGDGTLTDTLQLNNFDQIAQTAVTINTGGVWDMNGYSVTIGRLLGSGLVNNTSASSCTLTLNEPGGIATTFSGNITQSGGGVLTLAKLNTNTVTLTGTGSTFTGELQLNLGTTEFDNAGALGIGTAVRLGNAGTGSGSTTLRFLSSGGTSANLSGRTFTLNKTEGPWTANIINDSVSSSDVLTIGPVTTTGGPATKILTLDGSNTGSNTVSGIISDGDGALGGLSVIKSGAGQWVFATNNTYTGPTTVSGGTLLVTGSTAAGSAVSVASGATLGGNGTIAGSITLAGGAVLSPGTGGSTINTLATGAVTMNATSTYSVDLDGTGSSADRITSTSAVACAGTLTIASIANPAYWQTYTIVTATSLSGAFSGLPNNTIFSQQGRTFVIRYSATAVTLTDLDPAHTWVWDGGGADNNWTTGANWVGDVAPGIGSALHFAGTTRLTPNNDFAADATFADITFDSGAGAFVLGGNRITLTGTVTNSDDSVQTINQAMIMAATRTVDAASGNVVIGGVLSGAGGLTKTGAGTLTLTGTNTYSGTTTISAGTLSIGDGVTDGSIASSSGVANNSALVYNLTGAQTYANVISGTGTLTKTGAGTLTLIATNTYTGTTTISAGALSIGDGVTDGSIASSTGVTNNSALVYNLTGAQTYANVISGTGTLTKSGTGTLTLSGANTYTGITTISAGTLQIGDGTTDGSISNSASITNNGSLIYNLVNAQSSTQVISGSGGLTKSGNGTLSLIGASTYGGATDVIAGTLKLDKLTNKLTHRWSFNSSLSDSVGGSTAVLNGTSTPTLSATTVTLAGGARGTSWVSLGTSLLPATNARATIELWATRNATQFWSRIFDFGNDTSNYVFMSWTRANNLATDRVEFKSATVTRIVDDTMQPYTTGTEYAISMVITPNGSGTAITWYKMDSSGAVLKSGSTTSTWNLSQLLQNNMWLGHSFYGADNDASATYNEVRIWNEALSQAQLSANAVLGPDSIGTTIGSLPSTTALSVANGATMDLGGGSQQVASLSNYGGGGGSVTNSGTADATLTVSGSSSTTFAGVISDGGSNKTALTKAGSSTLTLSGANTYTGTTTVSAGTLLVNGSTHASSAVAVSNGGTLGGNGTVNGAITLASGGTIAPGSATGVSVGTLTTGGVTLVSGSTYSVDLNGTTPTYDLINATGTVTCGSATLAVASIANAAAGKVYSIISATAVSGTFNGLSNGSTFTQQSRTFQIVYTSTAVILTDVTGVANGTKVWDGGGSDNNWTTAANWVGDVAPLPGDALIFASANKVANTNDFAADTSFAAITFDNTAGAFTLSGNRITLIGDLTNLDGDQQRLDLAVILSGSRTVDCSAGNVRLDGIISGTGSMTKTGAQTLLLTTATNTYGGGTVISAGTVQIGDGVTVGSENDDALGTGTVTITAGGTLSLSGGDAANYYYFGNVFVIDGGTIRSVNGGRQYLAQNATITIGANGATFEMTASNKDIHVSGILQGSGPMTCSPASNATGWAGIWFPNNANTYSGTITFSSTATRGLSFHINGVDALRYARLHLVQNVMPVQGILDIGGASTVGGLSGNGSIAPWSGAGPVTLVVNDDADRTYAGQLTDSSPSILSVTKAGLGAWTLSGASDYTGATTVAAGSLLVNGSTAAASAVNVQNGATLGGSGTVNGAITLASGGTIAPGSATGVSVGTLTTGGVTLVSGSTYSVDLNGTTPTYDQINATGTVTCGSATLTVASIANAAAGKVYTIINASSVTGTFNGLANNAVFVSNGRLLRITYTATTVTLTDVAPVVTSRQTLDVDGDGQIDRIRLTFDQTLNDNTSGLTVTVAGTPITTFLTGTANDAVLDVVLSESGSPDTGATPTVQITGNSTLAYSGGGTVVATDSSTAATDTAKPVLISSTWTDVDGNGVDAGDTLVLTFSENVTSSSMVVADLGLPVTGDSLSTSTIADKSAATPTINVALAGTPLLTPGGTYASSAVAAGKPSGIYLAIATHLSDQATVPNTGLVGSAASAVDIASTLNAISIEWTATGNAAARSWALGTRGLGDARNTVTDALDLGIINRGDITVDVQAKVAASTPSGWTAAAAAGQNEFLAKAHNGTPVDGTNPAQYTLTLSAVDQDLKNILYPGLSTGLHLYFRAPTSLTVGGGTQQTITITLTARAPP